MLKVSQLIKFIGDMNPQGTPARLSFYNFLKHFCHPDQLLSTEMLTRFFAYTMDYPHWQGNRTQLGKEVQFILNNFNGLYQQKFDFSAAKFPQDMQVIEIEQYHDFYEACSNYLEANKEKGEKFRLISDQGKKIVAIVLKSSGGIEVRSFDRKFTIRKGQLEPLRTDLALHYNENLELEEGHRQIVEVAPYIVCEFTRQQQTVSGSMMRGFVFQKYQEFNEEHFDENAKIFLATKRMEQFFVDRRTDPYYGELTNSIERTISLIQAGDQEAQRWAGVVLNKAQNALDHVFVGDKLLSLLIRDLRNTSEGKEECLTISPLKELDLTN